MEQEVMNFIAKYGVSGFAVVACIVMWKKLDKSMDGMGARIRELESQIWGTLIGLVKDDIASRKNHTAALFGLTGVIEKAPCNDKHENLSGDITPL